MQINSQLQIIQILLFPDSFCIKRFCHRMSYSMHGYLQPAILIIQLQTGLSSQIIYSIFLEVYFLSLLQLYSAAQTCLQSITINTMEQSRVEVMLNKGVKHPAPDEANGKPPAKKRVPPTFPILPHNRLVLCFGQILLTIATYNRWLAA